MHKIFNISEKEENELEKISKIIEEKETKPPKHELKDFIDTFNFKGKEYEIDVQILLMQIFKSFEEKENSFKFLCNLEIKFDNFIPNIKDMELDFLVNNVNAKLFKLVLLYLQNNILIMNINGNKIGINDKNKNYEKIINGLNDSCKYDIIGEIGINALDDENKVEQFNNYSNFIDLLNNNNKKYIDKINMFYEKTGFNNKNEKIIFIATNSKFNEIYKYLEKTKLYENIINKNINYILCYLSTGINERIFLSNYLFIDEKKKYLLNKIKLSNNTYIKSEQFKKSCYKIK